MTLRRRDPVVTSVRTLDSFSQYHEPVDGQNETRHYDGRVRKRMSGF